MVISFFFFKQKTAYEMLRSLVGSEMCIRDSSSLNKLWWSELDVELHRVGLELAGAEAELDEGSPGAVDDGRWMKGWQFALSGPIYAGTNEIQRNIVAERVLGLPRK